MKYIKTYNNYKTNESIEIVNDEPMEIPEYVLDIHKRFINAGKDLFVVGGAVRDYIMGKIPHDYDLVTNAYPDEIISILKGYRADLQGKHFGVIRVFPKGCPSGIEIATYRTDISTGRDTKTPGEKVKIGVSIEEDAMRRDIRYNALYYNITTNEVIDLVGGVEDIKNNTTRMVGDPTQRFNEDRLRILRCFRFSARFNSKIDEKTKKALKEDNRLRGISAKDDVSQERIIDEYMKVIDDSISSNNRNFLSKYLDLLDEYNMFEQMFPEVEVRSDIDLTYMNHILIITQMFDINKDDSFKTIFIRKLKFPGDLAKIVEYLISLLDINTDDIFDYVLKRDVVRCTPDLVKKFGVIYGLDPKFFDLLSTYKLTVSGTDLINLGYKGAEIAVKKKELEKEKFLEFIKK